MPPEAQPVYRDDEDFLLQVTAVVIDIPRPTPSSRSGRESTSSDQAA
jgi:hypothetical protein